MTAVTAPTRKKQSPGVYWTKIAIGLFFMFIFGRIVPTVGSITRVGMEVIGIFIGLILYLSWFDLTWPPLLAIPALVSTGYIGTSDYIASMLGSTTIFQMIVLMTLCYAIRKSEAGNVIASWLITRKVLKGRPVLFCCVFLWGFFIASIFMGATSFLLAWEILTKIFEKVGYKKRERLPILMVIGTYMVASLGYCSMPIAGLQLSMVGSFNSVMATYGIEMNTNTYIVCGLLVGTVVSWVEGLSFRYIFRADMSKLADVDAEKMGIDTSTLRLNKRQIILLIAFICGLGYNIVANLIPSGTALSNGMSTLKVYGWFAILLVLLSWIRIDGEPVLDLKECMSKGVMWGALLCTGSFTVIGTAITSDECGIKAAITELLNPVFGKMNWILFLFIAIALTSIITNLMSNLATGVVIITIIAPFVINYLDAGINPSVLGCAIIISAMLGMLTMSAGAWSPVLIGNEWIDSQPLVLGYGSIMVVIYIIVATLGFALLGYIL